MFTPVTVLCGCVFVSKQFYLQRLRRSLTCKFPFPTVEDALAHPYLTSLHDISDEPVCMTPFSFDFEQHALTEEQMKELIYREALAFNPEYQHQ